MAQNTLTVSYKGTNIVNEDISSEVTKTLLTSGKYCEGDILITAEGGSGGTPYAIISVTYPSGSVCTCTKGSTVLTAEDTSGKFNFGVPEAGTWTVACTNGTLSKTENVVIDTEHQLKIILLSYATPSLNENDWLTISTIAAQGNAMNYWNVGDRKTITISGIGSYDVYILGFNHYGATNTIDFGCFKQTSDGKDLCLYSYEMNTSDPNTNGWKGSYMRYNVLGSTNTPNGDATPACAINPVSGSLMAKFPSDLRAVMKSMTIWTDNVGGGTGAASNVTTSADYLPLLAEFEIFGIRNQANSAEQNHQAQYAYYANGASKIKYSNISVSQDVWWWGRSVLYNNTKAFFCVVNGAANAAFSAGKYGVSPIFRV